MTTEKLVPASQLSEPVALTSQRLMHMLDRHPELLAQLDSKHELVTRIRVTLETPERIVEQEYRPDRWIYYRYWEDIDGGKLLSVVVERAGDDPEARHWVVTTFTSDESKEGKVIWTES